MIHVKISVDNRKCVAHGQCFMVDDEVFTVDETGHSNIGQNRPVPEGKEDSAEEGVYACPADALVLDEN